MYESYYGLQERPFDLTADPRFLFLTANHVEALALLRYALGGRKGIAMLLGEAGTGKTTLVRRALEERASQGPDVVLLSNPALRRDEFFEFLTESLKLPAAAGSSKARLLSELVRLAPERAASGGLPPLVIDEAQSLPDELLEEIRLLTNLQVNGAGLPVVLVGQPELGNRLSQPEFRNVKQRVTLRCQLSALTLGETAEYIAKRIITAGGTPATMFTRAAVLEIYQHSGGIPRIISVICDNALLSGFALDRHPVTSAIVREVCEDLDLPQVCDAEGRPLVPDSLDEPLTTENTSGDAAQSEGSRSRLLG